MPSDKDVVQKILVQTVGDSHSIHPWSQIPWARQLTIGGMTMYHFGLYRPIVVESLDKNIPVIFSWGEIDCRCHVYKHPPFIECIDKLVEDFLIAVDQNAKVHPKIWLITIPPPLRISICKLHENPGFPFLGSDEERMMFARHMSDKIRFNGRYPVLDVYDRYCDKDGFLIPEKSDYCCHITDPVPMVEAVIQKLREEEETFLDSIPDV